LKLTFNAIRNDTFKDVNSFKWNKDDGDIANWICELAASEQMLDQLIDQLSTKLKSKVKQFEICKILRKQDQVTPALRLGKVVLKKYTADELMELRVSLICLNNIYLIRKLLACKAEANDRGWNINA
jgi:hypothetical protein